MDIDLITDGSETGQENQSADKREIAACEAVINRLSPDQRLVMKLLHIDDYELTGTEIKLLAQKSGKSSDQIIKGLTVLREVVAGRKCTLQRLENFLENVNQWIKIHRRRIGQIIMDLASPLLKDSAARKLRREKQSLEKRCQKREAQKERIVAEIQRRKVTTPYKNMADLLNTTVGNVGSQIARSRADIHKFSK